MDTAQWPQEVGLGKSKEEIVYATCSRPLMERKARPRKEQALNCPRCNSTKTKFCYYNNYSLTQPRYFCKTCRRYWTEGGSLRNVPVGGGTRKNRRPSSSSPSPLLSSSTSALSASAISSKMPDLTPLSSSNFSSLNTKAPTTNSHHNMPQFVQLATSESHNPSSLSSFSELLKSSLSSRGLTSLMPMPMLMKPNNFHPSELISLHDFKPTLKFPQDGLVGGCVSDVGGEKLSFPILEDVKDLSNTNGDASGYLYGMLGGVSW